MTDRVPAASRYRRTSTDVLLYANSLGWVPVAGEPIGRPLPIGDAPVGRLVVGQADSRDIVIEVRGDAGAEWLGWFAFSALDEQNRRHAQATGRGQS
jgi:hypothetical protein